MPALGEEQFMRHTLRAVIGLLCLLSGAARANDALMVGYAAQSFAFTGAVETGLEQGFFSRAGLDVTAATYGGGARLHQAMLAGEADIAMAAASDFYLLVKGAPERAVYGVVNEPFSVGVSVADPAIRTPDDLKGRRIGVTTKGSYTFWFATEMPHFLHWTDGATVTPVSVGGSLATQTAALVTGQVDAVVGDIVLGLGLAQQGRGRIILNGADVVHDVVTALAFAHTDLIAHRPEVLRRYLAALRQSIDFLVAHREATVRLETRLSGLPEVVVGRYIDITMPGWSRDGRISRQQLVGTSRAIAASGLLPDAVDLAPYYLAEFAPK